MLSSSTQSDLKKLQVRSAFIKELDKIFTFSVRLKKVNRITECI